MEREYGPYIYTIEVYDEIEEKNEIIHGITFAHTWSKAMRKIEDHYGVELISVKGIKELCAKEVVELPESVIEDIIRKDY